MLLNLNDLLKAKLTFRVDGRKVYIRLVSYYVECRKMSGGSGRGVGASLPPSLLTSFQEEISTVLDLSTFSAC